MSTILVCEECGHASGFEKDYSLWYAQHHVHVFQQMTGDNWPRGARLPENPSLCADMLLEECAETKAALLVGDLPGIVDGCIDTIYVALGILNRCGVDAEKFFNLVHAANMAKAGGPKREDGKHMKPPGWQPPDIEGELRRQGWEP